MGIENKILAVVVLYNELLPQTKTYVSLQASLRTIPPAWSLELYLYDNSASPQSTDSAVGVVQYVHNPSNGGLGVAYNSAASYARDNGFDWLLLLDQDTTLGVDFLEQTIRAVVQNGQQSLFAPTVTSQNGRLISPFRIVGKVGKTLPHAILGVLEVRKYNVINSCMLIRLEAFLAVGGYYEPVKLDFSDTVFLERYSKKYRTLFISEAVCKQQLSTFQTDRQNLISRFALFCRGAAACPKSNLWARAVYCFVVLKRMLSLSIQAKSFTFVTIFWTNYVRR